MLVPMLLAVELLCLLMLLRAEYRKNQKGRILFKTAASVCFFAIAIVVLIFGSADGVSGAGTFGTAMFMGLLFGVFGDVSLLMPGKLGLLIGMGSFLIGHAFYILAFEIHIRHRSYDAPLFGLFIGLMIWGWWTFRPKFGKLLLPVVIYALVLSAATALSWHYYAEQGKLYQGPLMVAAGMTLFFFSDFCVARQRFATEDFRNKLIGLPLYYAGQTLIALSLASHALS